MENANSYIGDSLLLRLNVVEIRKHSLYVESVASENVEDIVIDIDENAADGKPEQLPVVPDRQEDQCGNAGCFYMRG